MTRYTDVFKDLFPKAENLFTAAEENSRMRCTLYLSSQTFSAQEKAAAVHIAAESGSYEAASSMLQSFAKDMQHSGVKILDVTRALAQHDPAFAQVLERYAEAVHVSTMDMIEQANRLTSPGRSKPKAEPSYTGG
jgi:hypothetical protein